MEPKEKARELYKLFWRKTPQPYTINTVDWGEGELHFQDWDKDWTHNMAKESALISVDEILKLAWDVIGFKRVKNYWEDVKKEIGKL